MPDRHSAAPPETPVQPLIKGAFAVVFAVQFVVAIGNTGMQSILPAIGREIGIPDPLVAAIYSLSALLWAAGAPYWAGRADARGRKPLIVLGLTGFMVSMLGCTMVIYIGGKHWIAPMATFVLFLLARGIFGWFGSAATPASQAYLAERTGRERRTEAIAGLAGAFGLGTIVGPAIAPLFLLPLLDLAGPTFAFAMIAGAMLIWVVLRLPETWPPPSGLPGAAKPKGIKRAPMWKDPRVRPFLTYGFLVASCQTAQYQTLGFLIIDKLQIPPMQAQGYTAIAMMGGAIAGLFAQWGLIRMFKMGPRHLLRWGVVLAAAANVLTAFAPTYWMVVLGFALSSLGYGFARPGFTAGASLSVDQADQARAAGAVAAINGLNVIAAPLFVLLYQVVKPGPYLMNVAILLGMLVYVLKEPLLRNAGLGPTTEQETAKSVERNDGSGGF